MEYRLSEISEIVGGELSGDPGVVITGISGIKEAKKGDITFLANPKYFSLLNSTQASAIITSPDVSSEKPLIKTDNPSVAFAKVVDLAAKKDVKRPQGVSSKASIDESVKLPPSVAIGPFAIIEEGVEIEDNTIVSGGCFIGCNVKLGKNCLIYPNATIREKTEIGDNVIIHSGAVIGSDGFGFEVAEGKRKKIPQIGKVVIENDAEIGSNVTIDRARFDKTVIGSGTKIDNLVQIAHNVIVGKNCIIIAQAGISGSTIIEDEAILAGQAGVVGHIKIGKKAIVAAQAGVTKSVPAQTKVSGYPAKPHRKAAKINACLQKLPETLKRVKELEDKIKMLEKDKINE